MTELIACPTCQTMNRPNQKRCRACGRSLRANPDLRASTGPEPVTSGEVVTAVVETTAAPNPDPEPIARKPDAAGAAPAPDLLVEVQRRMAERAASAGQRFKPYTSSRPRAPERPEDRVAITRELDAAARAFREKHYDTAIEHLLKAIAKDDRDVRSWALLGEAYLRRERPYKAAVGYLRVLELEPENGSAWLGLARALKAVGDREGARDVLDRAVRASPDLPELWSERGQVLEALGDRAEAAKSFAKVLELRPEHRTARERYGKLSSEASPPPTVEAAPSTRPEPVAETEEELPDFTDLLELPAKEAPKTPPPEGSRGRTARLRTYIEGLDEAIGGGIPWGHVVLIEGAPGTMKSSIGFSILLQNAARDGHHGLYLSLKERTSSLMKQMSSVGLHLQVNTGSFVVLDPRAARGLMEGRHDWVEALRSAVAAIQAQRGLDLIVIDSLEALEVLMRVQDRRAEIYRLFDWLRDLDVTSFVVTERPGPAADGHAPLHHGDEDFLADGILLLSQHHGSDREAERRLHVLKMRGTRHETGSLSLVLEDGRFRAARLRA